MCNTMVQVKKNKKDLGKSVLSNKQLAKKALLYLALAETRNSSGMTASLFHIIRKRISKITFSLRNSLENLIVH